MADDTFFMTGRYGKRSGAGEQLASSAAFELVRDRDRLRAGLQGDRDARSWRPKCSCQPYASAGALSNYYKRTRRAELGDSSGARAGH